MQYLVEREIEVQAQLAENSLNMIRSSLVYADSYINALTSTGYTQSYIAAPREPGNQLVSRMQKMHEAFPILNDQNGLLTRIYIYSRNSDTILDRYSGYLNINLHYEKIFRLGSLSAEQWKKEILQSRESRAFLSTEDQSGSGVLLYTCQLPVYPSLGGRIIFYLDRDALLRILNRSMSSEMQRDIQLYDERGMLLLGDSLQPGNNLFTRYGAIENQLEVVGPNGKKQILFSTSLPDYGLTLYMGIPRDYFTRHALLISVTTLRYSLPFSLFSLVLVFFVLHYSHHPLRAAIRAVPEDVDIQTLNPFKYVQQALHRLLDINRSQEMLLQNNRLEMQEAILSMLVYQKKIPNFPLKDKLLEYGIHFDADFFRALILSIRAPESEDPLPISNLTHNLVLQLVLKHAPQLHYIKMDGPEQMLFLALMTDEEDRTEKLHAGLTRLCWEINQAVLGDVRILAGSEVDSLEDVYYSFKQARDLIFYASSDAANCVAFCPPHSRPPVYDYTSEDARYLRQKANMGDADAVHERLRNLCQRNSGSLSRSSFERQLMYGHMISTLMEAGYSGELPAELTCGFADLPLDRFFEILDTHYQILCQQSRASEQQAQRQRVRDILEEIQRQLGDYNLTQASIAMKFGLAERKLSSLIREETGMTFTKYLEKKRIDKSVELLQKNELTIEEIARAVGYGSDKSFRRVFKQIMNQPPSSCRP